VDKLERILQRVQKPARYSGGEYNEIIKDKASAEVRIALCFPDIYEIGMSNLGIKILYGRLNAMEGVWCERVFAPWGDMDDELRAAGMPLFAIESRDSVADFDIIGFSLGYEMAYTAMLNMLSLSGLPLRSADRPALAPLVIAGGACTYNAEPFVDFVDICIIGEGEDVDAELVELYREAKRCGMGKEEFLIKAAQIEGVYVPSLYDVSYNEDGTIAAVKAKNGAPEKITKRIVRDFEHSFYPEKTIIPSTEIVHDRVVLEVFRGCIRGCRFCQAGHICRPVRSRSAETLIKQGIAALADSGYSEITLSSLSTSDYRRLGELCDGLLEWCEPRNISISLPSLRADNFSMELMQRVQKVRRSGLTFAPEAGSQRLRDAINKNVTEDDVLNTCRIAFEGGWNAVKLYFMMGLPTETDEDVKAIAELSDKVLWTWKKHAANKSRGVRITVSTSCFVPKPHTPFQWEAMDSPEEFRRKQELLRGAMRSRAITYNWHDSDTSYIEAALARGDRRMSAVLEKVCEKGGRLDAWGEYFSMQRWLDAFAECGLDPDFYALRERGEEEILPWSMIDCGVSTEHLLSERKKSRLGQTTPDCRTQCSGCGALSLMDGGECDE